MRARGLHVSCRRHLGVPMDTLLRMQAWHDSHAMRQRAGEIDVKRYEPA